MQLTHKAPAANNVLSLVARRAVEASQKHNIYTHIRQIRYMQRCIRSLHGAASTALYLRAKHVILERSYDFM